MCIRDRNDVDALDYANVAAGATASGSMLHSAAIGHTLTGLCLLYTSDAADERSSVDLGGRRIIKKKISVTTEGGHRSNQRHRMSQHRQCYVTTVTKRKSKNIREV